MLLLSSLDSKFLGLGVKSHPSPSYSLNLFQISSLSDYCMC